MASIEPVTHAKSSAPCACPACRGLECLERPRFFAGQLLTEADLNSEQAYLLAKNRLHNKYLHGSGVVCGLEVVCHKCEGWVRVKSGYALDPCGNDVVVCRDADLNVIEEIRKCIDARQRRDEDCPPWRDTRDTCIEDEVHWCIALEYVENETRGVMPLQEKSSGSCGCGGSTSKATKSAHGCGCQTKPASSPARPAACEATRVLEQYRLTVIPEPASCAGARTREEILARLSGSMAAFPTPGSIMAALLPAGLESNKLLQALVTTAPSESLLGRVVAVTDSIEAFFAARFNTDEKRTLVTNIATCLAGRREGTATGASGDVAGWTFINVSDTARWWSQGSTSIPSPLTVELCCKFRRAVRELYAQNPFNARCEPFDCPPCGEKPKDDTIGTQATGTDQTSVVADNLAMLAAQPILGGGGIATGPSTTNNDDRLTQLGASFCCLARALADYVVDSVCAALIPPCPPEPCDNRLILACVTIKDGRIVHICNHSCRRYAGSFPALEYWTSAMPVIPLVRRLLREICCAPSAVPVIAEVSAALQHAPLPLPPAQTQPTAPGQTTGTATQAGTNQTP